MDKSDIPKAYEPQAVEEAIYAAWEKSGFFRPENLPNLEARREAFTVILPPPNATGTLHMGHAVMLALEDIMIRFARMRGKRALWIPGTDHAAIATNAKVEKILAEEGKTKHDLGREAFLARVREFVAASQNTIRNQMRKMGASCDWSRETYTMDEGPSRAVRTVFKMMYDDGLMYRGYRIVNWCPRCQSTLADDEVEYKEEKTKFYYFKYGPIVIGTARPETKFLDKVLVVHPDDARYKDLVGKSFDIEWINGPVKASVIVDPAAEMDFGSGAMTITPAHDFKDFELAKRHGLEVVQIIDENGNLTEAAGDLAGRNARDSRDEIVRRLAGKGLVDHIEEPYTHNLSVCYRCGTPIEPLPKLQWFIDVKKEFTRHGKTTTLKILMQEAVRSDSVDIIPDRFIATYFHWIDNLRDWNVSRQIWFGHRVPVWYCVGGVGGKCLNECRHPVVSVTTPTECPACHGPLQQDPDTLDTWFSSGLWTFSTLGWPDETEDLKIYHPTSVLETGYDILFFWVARMILMTTYALGQVPFRTVYLHGMVRDEKGRKMSKSLDNIIDPLDMIKKYGADATRLSLVIGTTPGNDTKLSDEKVAGYRNFANKLWNIARFVLTSVEAKGAKEPEGTTLADRWILGRFADTTRTVTEKLERYEFSSAGEILRDFTWSEFADWYLEIAKVQRADAALRQTTDRILLFTLEHLLALWHPFMPFVTEEIWKLFGRGDMMMVHAWPDIPPLPDLGPTKPRAKGEGGRGGVGDVDAQTKKEFNLVRDVIVAVRNLRSEHRVAASQVITAGLDVGSHRALLMEAAPVIVHLGRLCCLGFDGRLPEAGIPIVSAPVGDVTVFIEAVGSADVAEKEKARLTKELAQTQAYLDGLKAKLGNGELLAKAPSKVIDEIKEKQAEAAKKIEAIKQQLSSL